MFRKLPWQLCLLSVLGGLLLVGCAQQVGDIDRTQPNKLLKTDLDGVWYMLETTTRVPPTSRATFIGETSELEKIVWVIEQDYLMAYRAYPRLPGGEVLEGPFPYGEPDYYEQPVAVYPITSHFDIQRQYNAATGEQTNVLVENTYDRPWYEREYVRVDWSRNLITNFDFISDWLPTPVELSYTIDEERGLERSIYFEREGDELVYFDLPRRLLVAPRFWGCIFSWPWFGWGYEDCTAAEIEVVTSYARTERRRDYEPWHYDDRLMNRFGYFRSERYTYDYQRGVLESGRQKLIQRHNIWQQSYRRDSQGNYVTDSQGNLVPIPVEERQVRTVTYYLTTSLPDDELLIEGSYALMEEWNRYAREGVAALQGVPLSQVPDVFVACGNPVRESDHEACGARGFSPRVGDLRYSTLWWVDSEQIQGPLGYGPSAADPETGEIISGRAHIYGAGINWYASYGLDIIRFMNGDITPKELVHAEHVREMVTQRTNDSANLNQLAPQLFDMPMTSWRERERDRLYQRESRLREPRGVSQAAVLNRLEGARQAGLTSGLMSQEFQSAVARSLGTTASSMSVQDLEQFDPGRWFSPVHLQDMRAQRMRARARGVDYADMFDPNVAGIAERYAGRTDYDAVWLELRAAVYYATAIHEVGHTLGLRHNFSGTYDSLNYFDRYWELRHPDRCRVGQNEAAPGCLFQPRSMGDLYVLNARTEEQLRESMPEYQYSSIMDYALGFNTDLHGLGRYDGAAIIFGYTGGSSEVPRAELEGGCLGRDRTEDPNDPSLCLVHRPGLIEVFNDRFEALGGAMAPPLNNPPSCTRNRDCVDGYRCGMDGSCEPAPTAAGILTSRDEYGFYFDDPSTLQVPYLERYHYTTVMQSFPRFDAAFERRLMRLDDFQAERTAGEAVNESTGSYPSDMPVRVPYLFCSDEWYEGILSCQVFAGGSDPFEMVQNRAMQYRNYYYFRDFKRDRLGWDVWNPLMSYYFYVFEPLSNYYQNWYLSPWGADDVMDTYYWLAINTGLNLLLEAMAVPSYGTYCSMEDGQLYHISDDHTIRGGVNQYYLDAYCAEDTTFYTVPQGEGRRRFTAYDIDSGYNFGAYPQEAGHVWTSLAAFWALVDPFAFVVGADGDVGTYAISFLDYFDDEIYTYVNAMLTKDYSVVSPVMEVTGTNGEHLTGVLHYPRISYVWDSATSSRINPEDGRAISDIQGPSRATQGICETCVNNHDCNGYTGGGYGTGGAYCVRGLSDDGLGYCIYDCYLMPADFCGEGYVCGAGDWCIPDEGLTCADVVANCSPDSPHGACPTGRTCDGGECVDLWPVVQTNTSLSQIDDLVLWGMLYSTFGWETRYNDQMMVFKMGTAEEVRPGEGFELVTFTDPVLGDTYGAIRESCDITTIDGGSVGICGECETNEDCYGWIGMYYGGVFCEALPGGQSYCIQDCGLDEAECDYLAGYSCFNESCLPDFTAPAMPSCVGREQQCSSGHPYGSCPEGMTCYQGECHEHQEPSALCQLGWSSVPGGAQMVLQGQEISQMMNDALWEWARYDGSDQAMDNRLYRRYSASKYRLERLLMEINTIRAVYAYFGKVY